MVTVKLLKLKNLLPKLPEPGLFHGGFLPLPTTKSNWLTIIWFIY